MGRHCACPFSVTSMQKLKRLPKQIYVAVSGGVDSVAALHFLNRGHSVTAAHYVHDSEYAAVEHQFVTQLCDQWGIPLVTAVQPAGMQPGESRESYWRTGRYSFFKQLPGTVITGATLDDAVEWYIMTCLRGEGHFMEYSNGNVCRPFLTTTKAELIGYARQNNLPWLEDPSNADITAAKRNRIRANLMPEICQIEPGIFGIVKKRVIKKAFASQSPTIACKTQL